MANELVLVGFYFVIMVYSIIIHEVSHGVMALWLGDLTAKYAGRLNLNPMKHIDPLGSIIVPVLMFRFFGFAFGWAKPVPYNPYNLRNQKWGPALVAIAGPISNILLALSAVVFAKLLPMITSAKQDIFCRFNDITHFFGRNQIQDIMGSSCLVSTRMGFMDRWSLFADALSGSFPNIIFGILLIVIFWNVLLAFFNLIPIPPLDGSKIVYSIFNLREETVRFLEQWGFFILIGIIFMFPGVISAVVYPALGFFFGLLM